MDKIVSLNPKTNARQVAMNATKPDLQKIIGIHEAASKVMTAKEEFARAIKRLWIEHPDYETVGDLLTGFGIDPHDFDDCL